MPIKTKRWNDPREAGDGFRLLVCRYRPRALPKSKETWDDWWKDLGPSRELHADFYGKHGAPIGWEEYRRRYLEEMRAQNDRIAQLAKRVAGLHPASEPVWQVANLPPYFDSPCGIGEQLPESRPLEPEDPLLAGGTKSEKRPDRCLPFCAGLWG